LFSGGNEMTWFGASEASDNKSN